jgi:OmpA-OmpF porin, OOP family
MKKMIGKVLAFFFLLAVTNVNAQIDLNKVVNRSVKKAERSVENRVERRIDKGVDKSLDTVEDGIDDAVKGDDSKSTNTNTKTKTETNSKGKSSSGNQSETSKTDTKTQSGKAATDDTLKPAPVLQWAKYDFVPGTEIIFEDNQEGEQNGEFPSKWDLVSGSVENANFDGENVIYFIKCNANSGGNIVPLIKNSSEDYLPEEFTIEFDAYYGEKSSNYVVFLSDEKNQLKLDKTMRTDEKWLRFGKNGGEYEQDNNRKFYPGFSGAKNDNTSKWRHISISFNTRALKAYMDDARILNIPNLGYNPTGFSLAYHNPSGTTVGYVKNIRIAKGAVPLYDKFLTDGKFVTTGIKFDVNKATIKAESMGTINYVVKMMQDHPELKFSVEGHTDSDGDDASNLKLSEARAKAVVDQMVKLGIENSRLTSKGLGESKPMAGNDTPEGKAQNRRVEFVKF